MRHLLCFLLLAGIAPAADKTGFLDRTMKGPDGVETRYVIFVPHNHNPAKPTPTILFLHGAGETGVDGTRQTQVGLGKAIRAREKTFPFIVVFPQAQKREARLLETWYPGNAEGDRAVAMLEAATKEFNGDPNRTYLTGISMGGFGTWKLAQAMPKKWAAIAPICGGGETGWAADIKNIPCWCFHGEVDASVPAARSRSMIEAMKAAGGKPKYDEYKGVGHNSWDNAYGTDALYDWFLSNTRK